MLFVFCALFSFVLIGWGFLFNRLFKTNLAEGLLNATAFSGLLIFYGFLFSIPQIMSLMLLGFGGFLFIFFILHEVKNRHKLPDVRENLRTICVYLALCCLCFFIAYGLKFRSIDDYSFWGTISKYLFIFHSLPVNSDYINPSYLTYIPGMASFHYLLYSLANQYSQLLGYFAQGLVLISAMVVFFDAKNSLRSLVFLGLWLILFTLAYGTIFARMEVDAYVAAYLFAITWLIYKKGNKPQCLFFPIIFLSVIKEIGLAFSVLSLILLALLESKNRKILFQCFGIFIAVLATKLLWKLHVSTYGFHSFSQGISLKSAASALNPFNQYYQKVQFLYVKEIFLASFDYLIKIPYIVIYLFIGGLWCGLLKKSPIDKTRLNKTMGVFATFALLYLVMLYCLQAIVFAVGHENKEILGFHRYYNMLFLPWFCLIIFIALDASKTTAYASLFKPAPMIIVLLATALLVGGKIERMRKFYQPNELYQIYNLVDSAKAQLKNKSWSVCLVNPPKPSYQITMPLSYFFMPNRIFYPASALSNCELNLAWDNNGKFTIHRVI
ncbi:hypothetical protein [Legionella cardiaca]|uniref:Glycosyltransferase RgtA/B/C/D-like domain-containing protein n=1 Tax=Legionella cardiaca TaxID=1071983 RepID=A0ABY8ASK4_9GAMM|nr:hypothetical protein [Legionella cardiaca]WED42759.1 hypothetical protein PXX05_12770 [Legionella cardiaca]